MPKDKNLGKHKSRFEVRGGVINEFDFHNNQGAMAVEERDRFARQEEERRLREGETEAAASAPQTEAERIQQVIADAHEKVQERQGKEQSSDASAQPAGSGQAKRSAKSTVGGARAGKKSAAKKAGSARKAAASGAKKSGVKKSAAKAGSKSAKKAAAAKKGAAAKGASRKGGAKKGGAGATRTGSRKR
ncbi:MAG TPA: hypothetical protein VF553_14270 [Pyrinomonadaceae bacterium]|jgi:hypothetical protein